MTVLPAFLHLKIAPHQVLHFLSKSHTADEHGVIRNVPYDTARALIDDANHPAREATAEDLAKAGEPKVDFTVKIDIELTGASAETTAPATEDTAADADASGAAPHDGEPLPETAGE